MSSFLESAACNGHQPEHIAAAHLVPRPNLVARLLRERHVARFLVAPDGFGKTQLAFQYAETVFSFFRVFWINGRSPCFLRDLDNEVMASGLLGREKGPSLAVFEDIPRLDDARAERFSCVVDALLEAGNEVLVTCAPSCDAYGGRHRDRLKLEPCDLLLSESECRLATPASRLPQEEEVPPPAERIACLRWGGDDGTALLQGLMLEELPSDVLLAMFAMLVLREGERSDVEAFVPVELGGSLPATLAEGYPYLGINRRDETYRSIDVPMPTLAAAFDRALDDLSSRSFFDTREVLTRRLADALVVRSSGERACQLMSGLAPKSACGSWLAARARALLCAGCVKPAHDLHAFVGRVRGPERWVLSVAESWRLVALDDAKAAIYAARRTAFSADAPADVRAGALIVVLQHGGAEVSARAEKELKALVCAERAPDEGEEEQGAPSPSSFWVPVARVLLGLRTSLAAGAEAWQASREAGFSGDALLVASVCLMDAAAKGLRAPGGEGTGGFSRTCLLHDVLEFVRGQIERQAASPMGLFVAMAALAFERACETGAFPDTAPLSTEASFEAHRVELSLFAQRGAYRRSVAARAGRRANFEATHPDAFRSDSRSPGKPVVAAVAPTLHVDLFGGLSVRIGDDRVDARLLRRQKARTLLALLVMNRGKELPRDRLVQELWPESELETARRNFYSVWSQLRRALTAASGACPYLVRAQSGFRLDARFLDSDLDKFEAMCRTLLFGRPRPDEWESLFAQASEWYADDLLPGEDDCEAVQRMRESCRDRLVDALVSASSQLVSAGEVRGGLWFAREALRHDKSREDSYAALMEAQIAAGQRAAALETYFACRRYLASELGIDPSLHTVRLYRAIIETEEEFQW